MTTTDWTTEAKGTGEYADVNGINLYYEIHGSGRPLVLLHGGLGSGEMFGPALSALAAGSHQVIAVDLQGHGWTADIDRPIDVRLMADDIGALIGHLGLEKTDTRSVAASRSSRPSSIRTRSARWSWSRRTSSAARPTRTCSRSRARSALPSPGTLRSRTPAGWPGPIEVVSCSGSLPSSKGDERSRRCNDK
jgi:hypothetical protein